MKKDKLIELYISRHIFPNIDWEKYDLRNNLYLYLPSRVWSSLYHMFGLTIDETVEYLNEWMIANVGVGPEFSVILESLWDESILSGYTECYDIVEV